MNLTRRQLLAASLAPRARGDGLFPGAGGGTGYDRPIASSDFTSASSCSSAAWAEAEAARFSSLSGHEEITIKRYCSKRARLFMSFSLVVGAQSCRNVTHPLCRAARATGATRRSGRRRPRPRTRCRAVRRCCPPRPRWCSLNNRRRGSSRGATMGIRPVPHAAQCFDRLHGAAMRVHYSHHRGQYASHR